MASKHRISRLLAAGVMLAVLELAGAAVIQVALTGEAQAQRYNRGGGFFQQLFGGFRQGPVNRDNQPSQSDSSRAPPPPKSADDAVAPTISVVIMGDAMADWLAHGLEDAFADAPEIGILRRSEARSGLVRYKFRSDLDWWHVARDILSRDKADYVVMMLGVNDRRAIRDADKDEPEPAEPKTSDNDQQPAIVAPEPQRSSPSGPAEFRSERWAETYIKRIDATVAALKSKGVPVIWVGLPPIRGTRSTADAVYLNDLFRARAERAGAVYVDIWDGFIDEGGKFSYHGPDFEGQIRRLRAGDGVYFTKSGARKLAHYVERELRRLMSNRAMPIALPSGGAIPQLAPNAPRPLAGPVIPLTVVHGNTDELVGGASARPDRSDPTASRVLVKGEPLEPAPGRSDDFGWPRGSAANATAAPAAASASAEPPEAAPAKPAQKKAGPGRKTSQAAPAKPKANAPAAVQPQQRDAPRPPRPVAGSRDPFGWLR